MCTIFATETSPQHLPPPSGPPYPVYTLSLMTGPISDSLNLKSVLIPTWANVGRIKNGIVTSFNT